MSPPPPPAPFLRRPPSSPSALSHSLSLFVIFLHKVFQRQELLLGLLQVPQHPNLPVYHHSYSLLLFVIVIRYSLLLFVIVFTRSFNGKSSFPSPCCMSSSVSFRSLNTLHWIRYRVLCHSLSLFVIVCARSVNGKSCQELLMAEKPPLLFHLHPFLSLLQVPQHSPLDKICCKLLSSCKVGGALINLKIPRGNFRRGLL